MSKEDMILSVLQEIKGSMREQQERQVQLESQIRELTHQNEKLQLNLIAMSPIYSEEERKAAMMKLSSIQEEEVRKEEIKRAFK